MKHETPISVNFTEMDLCLLLACTPWGVSEGLLGWRCAPPERVCICFISYFPKSTSIKWVEDGVICMNIWIHIKDTCLPAFPRFWGSPSGPYSCYDLLCTACLFITGQIGSFLAQGVIPGRRKQKHLCERHGVSLLSQVLYSLRLLSREVTWGNRGLHQLAGSLL